MSFDTVTFWLFFAVAWAAWRWLPFGAAKSAALGLSLGCNLGLLAAFKYTPLLATSAWSLMGAGGQLPWPDVGRWIVPVGISFYTFQTLSYSLDVYRGRLAPIASFRDFLLFVSFFPQLVAGPIVRAGELLPQLRARRPLRAEAVQRGLEHVVTGLFLKLVVADNLSPAVARVFDAAAPEQLSPAAAWVGALCFSAQIFADFAGYSGMAIGMAYLMGLRFPVNFDWPYAARSLSEFWSRWHITLSTWLRDYLYIPLGGNRRGRARTLVNLSLTMVLGGLWHGAGWTYLAWGAWHGAGLCVERLLGRRAGRSDAARPPRGVAAWLGTLARVTGVNLFVVLGWVLFRAPDLEGALALWRRMLVAPWSEPVGIDGVSDLRFLSLVAVVLVMHLGGQARRWRLFPRGRMTRAALSGACLVLLVLVRRETVQEFLYFQF